MLIDKKSADAMKLEKEFLKESNAIEGETSFVAYLDAANAWRYMLQQKELTSSILLESHKILMERKRPDIAGQYRNVSVRVGIWIAPSPEEITVRLNQWFHGLIFSDSPSDSEEQIRQAHINFEHIHPFEDGNGRIGRMIMNWQRVMAGLPLLVIHTGKEQQEYYKWFQ